MSEQVSGAPQTEKARVANEVTPVLDLRNICKAFGAVQALSDVSVTLRPREILGMVGDNAAGKSTLMKIAAGVLRPDSGEIRIYGQRTVLRSPLDARAHGIEMIFQDLALFNTLDVAANIFIGREISAGPFWLNNNPMWDRAAELLAELRVNISSPKLKVARMSGGQRQMVAVARALAFGSKILIMDEPTAALGVREATSVLDTIERLAEDHSIVLISQRLPDVIRLAHRLLVLKGGRSLGILNVPDVTVDEVARMIVRGSTLDPDEASVD